MVANDAEEFAIAANIKYTENAARLPLTEGLWFTAAGLTDYKVVLADPQGGAAAFIGVVTEHMPPGNRCATPFWHCALSREQEDHRGRKRLSFATQ